MFVIRSSLPVVHSHADMCYGIWPLEQLELPQVQESYSGILEIQSQSPSHIVKNGVLWYTFAMVFCDTFLYVGVM